MEFGLSRAVQLASSSLVGQRPAREPARELVRELDSVMEFGLYRATHGKAIDHFSLS